MESWAAHTHPKNTQVPPPGGWGSIFRGHLSKVVDVHAPLKTRFVTSRPSALWYSEEIAAEKPNRKLEGVGVSLELKQISCNMPISVVEFVSS